MVAIEPQLGEGVYTFTEATEILSHRHQRLTPSRLRYWMQTGLTPASYSPADGHAILSFHDLISLEVVGRFNEAGCSIQRVRKIEEVLRAEFGHLRRPFAYKLFFTDGASLWAQHGAEPRTAVELFGRRSDAKHKHLAWSDAVATFADEIRFGGPSEGASEWDLSPWVAIDPAVQFGTPVVRGTRIPVRTIAANLEAGTPEHVADWYGLSADQIQGVRAYLAVH